MESITEAGNGNGTRNIRAAIIILTRPLRRKLEMATEPLQKTIRNTLEEDYFRPENLCQKSMNRMVRTAWQIDNCVILVLIIEKVQTSWWMIF